MFEFIELHSNEIENYIGYDTEAHRLDCICKECVDAVEVKEEDDYDKYICEKYYD